MSTMQKWLTALTGLGALAIVVSNPNGVYKAALGFNKVTAGSVTQIVNASNKGH